MRARGRPKHPDILTPREWEVLNLLRGGRTNDEIAEALGISVAGVKYHVSEILGKLDVADRKQAADWDGKPQAPRPRAHGILAWPRSVRWATFSPAGGGVVVVAAAVIIGLLAWGAVRTTGGGNHAAGGWTYSGTPSGHPSVLLFDLAKRSVTQLPVSTDVAYARWAKQGQTFVARGQTARADDYGVWDIDGQHVFTPLLQGDLTSDVVPAPDGASLLVGRSDNQYLVSEIPTGLGSTFLTGVRNLAFSPDGKRMAYLTVGGSDEENVNHDWRSVIITEKSDLAGYAGGGVAIQSQREADGLMDLIRQPWSPDVQPWSPDGKYLLVVRYTPCFAGAATSNCYGLPTYEVYGTELSGKIIWSEYPHRLQSAIWAGPDRLFVTFYADGGSRDPDYPEAQSLYVDFGTLKLPAPAILQGACCVAFSPDGRYAIVRHLNEDTGRQRCSLVDSSTGAEIAGVDATDADIYINCGSVSWTSDGSEALVSSANGN